MSEFDLTELDYTFRVKPLLIGGMAMEFYGLRPSGDDVDFVVSIADYEALAAKYPDQTKDLDDDKGVVIGKYEVWTSICLFDHANLSQGAIEKPQYKIIALEKLLLLKAFNINEAKHLTDVKLSSRKFSIFSMGKIAYRLKYHFFQEKYHD